MRSLVVRVAVLVAMLTVWIPEIRGHKHRVRIVVPHKITHIHHHHIQPKRVVHHHDSEEYDSEEHQEARVGPPRYAIPASKRYNGPPPFSYRHFFRKRTKPPRRYYGYEDDFRRWLEEEDYYDSDEYR